MHRFLSSQTFLVVYSGALTVAFAVTVFGAWHPLAKRQIFDEIEVRRIDVVEPDGTPRLIISNRAVAPGIIIKGKEHPHPDRQSAGMIFFDDEGTENGGLIFGGEKRKDGTESSYGHLSFDRYDQDQVFTIDANQNGAERSVGLRLNDQPDYPIEDLLAVWEQSEGQPREQRDSAVKRFVDAHGSTRQRLSIYRTTSGAVELRLKDVEGRDRLVMSVGADGAPSLRLLDDKGNSIGELSSTRPAANGSE